MSSPPGRPEAVANDVLALRRATLLENGAEGTVVDELLAYNENRFDRAQAAGLVLPLEDEPHLAAWTGYAEETASLGVVASLRKRFVQLLFPVAEGVSKTEAYRAATRKGQRPAAPGPGPDIRDPEGIELVLHPTVAGRIPLLVIRDRTDFVTLVRVFSARNEPIPVPDSMGACIVTGLNNWDRVARYRAEFEERSGLRGDEAAWLEEFRQRLVPQRPLYQDRFILLSRGPYSAVPASTIGRPEAEWLRLSLDIRREHECTHYFTCRVFGSMRNNLLDEVIADFAGLLRVFGAYDGDLALRFFGLEGHPRFREGGRLESYLGDPPLSAPAVGVLRSLVFKAVRNIENFADGHEALQEPGAAGRMVAALTAVTLEELAASDMAGRLDAALNPPEKYRVSVPGTDAGIRRALVGLERLLAREPAFEAVRADFGVALDEIVSNVVKYGYGGGSESPIIIEVFVRPGRLEVEVIDEGEPFNPLERDAPDTAQALDDRPIGGLGIHIVKELMDDVSYRRQDGRNHLSFAKRLPPR
ncbi:MAG TPA: ATP-binding protein [Vicinamibacteria bacterium]|nr:ATP-binding protein [Vicinamibacteria bacterium]